MKTFHGGETDVNGKLTAEARHKFEDRVVALQDAAPKDGSRPRPGTLAAKYQASREHALASDRALASVTGTDGDIHFKVDRFAGKLLPHEERFTIEIEELPKPVVENSKGMKKNASPLRLRNCRNLSSRIRGDEKEVVC